MGDRPTPTTISPEAESVKGRVKWWFDLLFGSVGYASGGLERLVAEIARELFEGDHELADVVGRGRSESRWFDPNTVVVAYQQAGCRARGVRRSGEATKAGQSSWK